MDETRSRLAYKLRRQARSCASLGSPLYELILERAAEDVEAGGRVWRVLEGREEDPLGSARALRFVGAVHRLVLSGAAPALEPFYPSVGGDGKTPGIWDVFLAVVEDNEDRLRELALRPVQTNEVGRAGDWLARELEGRPGGSAIVVFHSIVMQYVDPDERERIEALFEEHGAAATDESPLARLQMEPAGEIANVSLEIWPPGGERLVATTGYHGAGIRWLGL